MDNVFVVEATVLSVLLVRKDLLDDTSWEIACCNVKVFGALIHKFCDMLRAPELP